MTCDACSEEIKGAPVLVPKIPRGLAKSARFCAKPSCVRTAARRAAVVWPRIHPTPKPAC